MPKLYVTANEPGFVRVSNIPGNSGVRMPVIDLIYGLANRGRMQHG